MSKMHNKLEETCVTMYKRKINKEESKKLTIFTISRIVPNRFHLQFYKLKTQSHSYFERKTMSLCTRTSSYFSARNFICLVYFQKIFTEREFWKAIAIWKRLIHSYGKKASVYTLHINLHITDFGQLNQTFLLQIRGLRNLLYIHTNQWSSASPLSQYVLQIHLEYVMWCLRKWIGLNIWR